MARYHTPWYKYTDVTAGLTLNDAQDAPTFINTIDSLDEAENI